MRWSALLMLCAVLAAPSADAQYPPAKEAYADQVMVPFRAFARDQMEGPLNTSLDAFKAKLRGHQPGLFAQHEDEVEQMLRGLIVTSIETFMAEIRTIFLDVLSTDELARVSDQVKAEDWELSDLAELEKWPEISKRIAEARQVHQRGVVLMLTQTVLPRMKELGFYPETKN